MTDIEAVDLFGKTTGCDPAEMINQASLRNDQGYNYLIVSPAGEQRFPIMVFYFKDEYAVVTHVQDEESGMQILTSDSSTDEDEMDFLSPTGEYDSYTGNFIVAWSTAVKFLQAFATGAPWPELPFWETL